MYCYNGAQRYEQFLQVGWLYRALILLGLALYHPSASLSLIFVVLYIYIYIDHNFFGLHLFYLLVSWACWDWPLIWLTDHYPLVLWHCWLGHVTRKIVSEMTYNVSSGTLNPTIPYHTTPDSHNISTLSAAMEGSCLCVWRSDKRWRDDCMSAEWKRYKRWSAWDVSWSAGCRLAKT